MKVLILASLKPETGNFSTASRIQRCLIGPNVDCLLQCISCFRDSSSVKSFVNSYDVQCVIGVHAWRAGKFLLDCPVPFAVIFGGTDLNEHHKDQAKLKIMTEVIEKARYLVAFSSPMRKQAMALWPKSEQKIIIQPQAVSVEPSEFNLHHHLRKVMSNCYSKQELYNLRRSVSNGYSSNLLVFLLVAGLRPVKDPLYLARAISDWHKEDPRVFLVIVGPELDTEFAEDVKSTVQRLPGVLLIPPLPSCDLHAAIQSSFAVVNSSTSEGMASVILEAMELGVPVIARNIPGNSAVISHGQSGLLFDTSQEFLTLAKQLMNSPSLRAYVTSNAKNYVAKHHSIDKERTTYISLVKELVVS